MREADEAARVRLREASDAMVDGVEAAVAAWTVRQVTRLLEAWDGLSVERRAAALDEAAAAGREAGRRIRAELAAVLALDPDAQAATPLEVVRSAVREPSAVLAGAGVPEVVRDEFDERAWPEDGYGLVPRTMRDLDEDLAAVHFAWGVAKAQVLRLRREGEAETGGPSRPR